MKMIIGYHREHRVSAPKAHRNHGSGRGSQSNRDKRTRAKFKHKQFNGKHDAGERSLKHTSQTSGSSTSKQGAAFRRRRWEQLAQQRAECRSRLNDGTFRAERAAAADGNGRAERLKYADAGFHDAAVVQRYRHRLRNTVALNFRREVVD